MKHCGQSLHDLFLDVLQASLSASWLKLKLIGDSIRRQPTHDSNLSNLFLRAICSIRSEPEFSGNLTLLAEHNIAAAVELSIAGAHLSLCSQFVCVQQLDRARAEAIAFGRYAIAAAKSIGFSLADSEQELLIERAISMPARINSQQSLSLATTLGHIPKKLLFVLGMHRSGTSALAGLLQDLGLDAPIDLLPPTSDNPKGYFESTGISSENDRLLAVLGTSWRLENPLPRGWIDSQLTLNWQNALLGKLHESFRGVGFPIVKDPRFCVLLAGLSSWLQAMVVDFSFVLIVRHPLEVVQSLLARPLDPIAKDLSLRLWIESVLSSERITRGMQRMVITADDLFESPACVQSELQSFIGLGSSEQECKKLSSFVDPELRHHRFIGVTHSRPSLGVNESDLLEDLAMRIYEEVESNQRSLRSEYLDEFYSLWTQIA
jgi:hypothetical protein